ncbi:hypothetical protein EDB84DRAFT_1571438 [Lactarius hengduanensis]|nr:hypothetical protein EDB84DRAFT_1571438 [Lactarius hengduanensis]
MSLQHHTAAHKPRRVATTPARPASPAASLRHQHDGTQAPLCRYDTRPASSATSLRHQHGGMQPRRVATILTQRPRWTLQRHGDTQAPPPRYDTSTAARSPAVSLRYRHSGPAGRYNDTATRRPRHLATTQHGGTQAPPPRYDTARRHAAPPCRYDTNGSEGSSEALTSPLNLPEQLGYGEPGYEPTDYQDIDTGLGGHGLGPGGDPLISTAFIEAVAQSMGFSATDEDYRSSLHSIPKIAPGMAKGHVQLAVYQTGLMYAILKECRAISEACRSDRAIMSDVHTRLEETFAFTPEQKVNIRLVSGELLLDPNRVRYTQMSIDVEIRIRERQRDLRFFHIFGNLARQRLLGTIIRRTCSSLRNAYREMLRDSVIGSNTLTLDDFVINLTNRFPSSLPSQVLLGRPFIVHVALLRRFAMENPLILDRAGEDEFQEDDEETPSTSRSGSAQPDGGPDEDISRPSSAMSGTTSQRNGKKRKRTGNALPHLKGNDFWSMVEKWFASRMQQNRLGTSWTSPGWTKYIEETLRRDREKFKPIPILNPFLADFDEVAGGTGDDNGVAQPHTSSTIGSMQGIIGIL